MAAAVLAIPHPAAAVSNGRIAVAQGGDVLTVSSSGGDPVKLIENGRAPAWTLDGTQIAFVRPDLGAPQIWTADADGSNERYITDGLAPSWSPDGTQIAFRDPVQGIGVVHMDGSDLSIIHAGPARGPEWSPDSMSIVFSEGAGEARRLFTIDPDGTNVKAVPTGQGDAFFPSWSPDADELAFVSTRQGGMRSIYTVDLDGSNLRRLTDGGGEPAGWDTDPSWSPDGVRVIFVSPRGLGDAPTRTRLWSVRASGKEERLLYSGASSVRSPDQVGKDLRFEGQIWKQAGDSGAFTLGRTLTAHTDPPPANANFALWGSRGAWRNRDSLYVRGRAYNNQTASDAQIMALVQSPTDPATWTKPDFSTAAMGPDFRLEIPVYPLGAAGSEDWQAQLIYIAADNETYFYDPLTDSFSTDAKQAPVILGEVTDGPRSPYMDITITREADAWVVRIVEDGTGAVWADDVVISDLKDTGEAYYDIHGLLWSGDGTQRWSTMIRAEEA